MIECFKIQLLAFDCEEDVLDVRRGEPLMSVPCLTSQLVWNPTIIEADPFLFVHGGRLHLFYESKGLFTPGVIKMTSTADLRNWTEPQVVLREPFHLSYPWVFEEEGRMYMVPETGSQGSVRLYEAADEGLTEFRFARELLRQPEGRTVTMGYGDSSIYQKDGKYYLMTMLRYEEPVNVLELYVSDHLEGPYQLHPASPIAASNKTGRDAGCWLELGGRLLRFSQDCVQRYGDNVHVSEITRLSPTEYEERLVREKIIPTDVPFYREGGHQFNAVPFKGKWIVATDAKEYHQLLAHRAAGKLWRMMRLPAIRIKKLKDKRCLGFSAQVVF